MIVRHLNDVLGTERDVRAPNGNWASRRLLLERDGLGFSLHDTTIFAGTETYIWYRHHLEAVYCIEGEGELEDLSSGEVYPLTPGTLYALTGHENHYLRARTNLRLICVFNPPLVGNEVHREDGSYPLFEGGRLDEDLPTEAPRHTPPPKPPRQG